MHRKDIKTQGGFTLVRAVGIYAISENKQTRDIAKTNIKFLLDNKANPNAVILLNNEKASIVPVFVLLEAFLDMKLEIIDFLIENGDLNLQEPIYIDKNGEKAYIMAGVLASLNFNDDNFKLFQFLVKKKSGIKDALEFTITLIGNKASSLINNDKFVELKSYIQSDEYKKTTRKMLKKYLYEIFTNYSEDKFSFAELSYSGKYFIYTNDTEFIQMMIDNDYLKNEKLYEFMLKTATNVGTKEIINQIKGVKK